MNVLNDYELAQMFGGGYWWLSPSGQWIYIEDDEAPMVMTSYGDSQF